MEFVLDRFEGKYAVIEDENGITYNIPKEVLPHDMSEGDVLLLIKGDRSKKENKIGVLMDELFE